MSFCELLPSSPYFGVSLFAPCCRIAFVKKMGVRKDTRLISKKEINEVLAKNQPKLRGACCAEFDVLVACLDRNKSIEWNHPACSKELDRLQLCQKEGMSNKPVSLTDRWSRLRYISAEMIPLGCFAAGVLVIVFFFALLSAWHVTSFLLSLPFFFFQMKLRKQRLNSVVFQMLRLTKNLKR